MPDAMPILPAAPERVRDSTTPAVPGALAAAGASQGHALAASNGSAHGG